MAADLMIRDAVVLDCTGADPRNHVDIVIKGGRIHALEERRKRDTEADVTIDGSGLCVLPGLTDAHVHFAMIGPAGNHGSGSWVSRVLTIAKVIQTALDEGFTTVRDAGGLEPAYAHAVRSGQIMGPRILPSGSTLSQTGGHGDMRERWQSTQPIASIPGLLAAAEIVDGPDAVRKAAREQLRRGATQIKVFASGGVLSPTDPFGSIQFSREELQAAVDVARSWGTYVLAHCHTSPSINNALDAGVRSIEHASITDVSTAKRMAREGAFAVPTLLILDQLRNSESKSSLSDEQLEKLESVAHEVEDSLRRLVAEGVRIASGSDIVGPEQRNRASELALKAAILGNEAAIYSATRTNADLFGLSDRIGTVEVGKDADLIAVDGQPLDDIQAVANPTRVRLVIRNGEVVKDLDDRATQV